MDSSWVFSLILAAWTLVLIAGHVLAWRFPAVVTLVVAAAAIGLFASLVVHAPARALSSRPVAAATGESFEALALASGADQEALAHHEARES
jgi:hypothetical protein